MTAPTVQQPAPTLGTPDALPADFRRAEIRDVEMDAWPSRRSDRVPPNVRLVDRDPAVTGQTRWTIG